MRIFSDDGETRRSIVPETVLALSAIVLSGLALAWQNPRETDVLLTRVTTALLTSPMQDVDMETTASIAPRRRLAPDERRKPVPQPDGDIDGSSADGVDINVGELSLRGSL